MKKIKIFIVFGTRPEAIKMAPICIEAKNSNRISSIVCVTAQHREMLDQVMELFDIKPDIDLNIMNPDQDLFDISSNILLNLRKELIKHQPDLVLVHGDTTTSMIASMASFYLGIKVGHVEAGLRTYNIKAPFPEEFNRRAVSMIAEYHFAPTKISKNNLLSEKVDNNKIFVTGNSVIDALFIISEKIKNNDLLSNKLNKKLCKILDFDIKSNNYILITGHRRESFGTGFLNICKAIKKLSEKYQNFYFIYPVHLNPNVRDIVHEMLGKEKNIILTDPLKYEPFIFLIQHCYLILTDSGGIQEEAPSIGKPVLVMRNETERPEAIQAGTVKLVGSKYNSIVKNVSLLIDDKKSYKAMANSKNPYGDGKTSSKIIEIVISEMS